MSEFKELALNLVRGGYDLHTHTSPSHSPRSLDDFTLLNEADEIGMAGVMIKSHYEPTEARASLANIYAGSKKAKAYGAIALNWPVGGLNPYAVESSLYLGGVLVWMPTRDAQNCLKHGKDPKDMRDRTGISLFNNEGKIKKEVFEIMEIVRKFNAYLATGHFSTEESLRLCHEGRKMGVNMILTHPDWHFTTVPLETQIEIAMLGVLIEKVYINIIEKDITAEKMIHSIKTIGADNILIVTDRGQAGFEKPAEAIVSFLELLLKYGISQTDIKKMVCDNPRQIVKG